MTRTILQDTRESIQEIHNINAYNVTKHFTEKTILLNIQELTRNRGLLHVPRASRTLLTRVTWQFTVKFTQETKNINAENAAKHFPQKKTWLLIEGSGTWRRNLNVYLVESFIVARAL